VADVGILIGCGVIGGGIGYAVCMWWEWRKARQLRREISSLLVQQLAARANAKLKVVK
jgi:hypothetical protein